MQNLTYTHPSSCNSQLSSQPLFNYTTVNISTTSNSALSSIACPEGGSPSDGTIVEDPLITKQEATSPVFSSWRVFVILILALIVYLMKNIIGL